MLTRSKLAVAELLGNPKARSVFVLGVLIIAALVGGAPSDFGDTSSGGG